MAGPDIEPDPDLVDQAEAMSAASRVDSSTSSSTDPSEAPSASYSADVVESSTTAPPPVGGLMDELGGIGGVIPPLSPEDMHHNEILDEEAPRSRLTGPWLIGSRTASKDDEGAPVLYRNYDVDSQERERELEERAREQYHPADLEDSNVHEVNHYVPEDEQDDIEAAEQQQQQQQRSVARWYLLLLAGNSTTVRLRQKDFAKYLKLNLAARLSVEYNDLRVNRVEFKPLLMVNVTIFSRPKDNEEVPLHMLAATNATLLELSGEEYHVVRFLTIPNEHQEAMAALASGGFQADSYTGAVSQGAWHVDMGVAVYFAIAAAFVAILLAVFLVGCWRYVRNLVAESSWRPWRRYKHFELPPLPPLPALPRWNLPLQHRLCADHIVHCAPLRMPLRGGRPAPSQQAVWTTADADVPVQKILAPEPPPRLMFAAEPGREMQQHAASLSPLNNILCGEAAPSTADTLLQTQPAPLGGAAPAAPAARPNSKLSLFGEQQVVVQPDRSVLTPGDRPAASARKRLQPQGRHPLDVRIGVHPPRGQAAARGPAVLGVDNPNYMLQ